MAMCGGSQREASFWQRIRQAKGISHATPLKASWSYMLRLLTTRASQEGHPVSSPDVAYLRFADNRPRRILSPIGATTDTGWRWR
jgi:hypothetical protein